VVPSTALPFFILSKVFNYCKAPYFKVRVPVNLSGRNISSLANGIDKIIKLLASGQFHILSSKTP